MAAILDKVIDIAKKLRKSVKKINDPDLQNLITDLNLSLTDLKMQEIELREAAMNTPTGSQGTAAPYHAPVSSSSGPDIGDLRNFPN